MKMEKIEIQENHWIKETARICGDVTVGCSDTAGILEKALTSADFLKNKYGELTDLTLRLDSDIAEVTQATSDARGLSESAIGKLNGGTEAIGVSMERFSEMIALIESLGTHITGFASAMEQVKRVSQSIDTIARTTNMLALNAAIEAEKADEAGQTFAVVAAEVKKLALDTRTAAVEITGTVNSLSNEASKFVGQIEEGIATSGAAQQQFSNLRHLIDGVAQIVGQVGDHNREIAESTSAIHQGLVESQQVRDDVAEANGAMFDAVTSAHHQIVDLENQANRMFDHIVHSGLSTGDLEFVELCMEEARTLVQVTEAAIAAGTLTMEDLFDKDYQPVAGSNPPRFTTRLTRWAEQHWQPVIEEIKARRPDAILSCVPTSREGFLPIHLKQFSQKPTGDLAHDTKNCRNGRILLGGIDDIAKASEQDYMMAVYRHEGDGKTYKTVRNVYVPLRINGRRWGDAEIAYSI
ncbi:MAG TPA: methyl-accepting chemotaxis protein [Sphingorhabdus sp.]|nr:methyl-accepting chemotaxis protein [Sphingorhabdus sp.]